MSLLSRLRAPWLLSVSAGALGLLATLLVVWFAGPAVFADYAIDMAKLSVVVLLLESVPSPYAILKAQQDDVLKRDLATFAIAGAVLATALTIVLSIVHVFEAYSFWLSIYAAYLAGQRYFDVKLQAEGRVAEYFQITVGAVACRVLLLTLGFWCFGTESSPDVVWGAIAIGSLAGLLIWLIARPNEFAPFLRCGHLQSAARLVEARRSYAPYYVNVSLKRIRDSAMPILCGVLVTDQVQIARFLLAYRGVDFVCGQLRLAEALLANLAIRQELKPSRGRAFAQLAIGGQVVAFAASAALAGQVGWDSGILALSLVASAIVYPYTLELVGRSDAYAEQRPVIVTWALAAYIAALCGVISVLAAFGELTAPALVVAPLAGQTAAALTYLAVRRYHRS